MQASTIIGAITEIRPSPCLGRWQLGRPVIGVHVGVRVVGACCSVMWLALIEKALSLERSILLRRGWRLHSSRSWLPAAKIRTGGAQAWLLEATTTLDQRHCRRRVRTKYTHASTIGQTRVGKFRFPNSGNTLRRLLQTSTAILNFDGYSRLRRLFHAEVVVRFAISHGSESCKPIDDLVQDGDQHSKTKWCRVDGQCKIELVTP